MSELLLEFLCEELPLWAQRSGRRELNERISAQLRELGFWREETIVRDFATPRRLCLTVDGLAKEVAPRQERRRGPRKNAPAKAIEGFCKSVGVSRAQLQEEGDYFYAILESPGERLGDALAHIIAEVIGKIGWQKSMRWGDGVFRFPRPLRSILCLVDGNVVDFELAGVKSGAHTCGHRFMSPDSFEVEGFADYERKLSDNKVILDSQERIDRILSENEKLAAQQDVRLVANFSLLAETASLSEHPVPILCGVGEEYMGLPDEVLREVIEGKQKYFTTRKKDSDELAPFCIAIADVEAGDAGATIRRGNERVLRARLADADFFYKRDLEKWKPAKGKKLKEWQAEFIKAGIKELDKVVFHRSNSLGYQSERVAVYATRMVKEIDHFRWDSRGREWEFSDKDAEIAVLLSKIDLLSEVVREFPELQGIMGGHYARLAGFSETIADAVAEHYRPQGIDDFIPRTPLGQCLSLAEKIGKLAALWQPRRSYLLFSGSGDAYGVRRAALGVIRIILEGEIKLSLGEWIKKVFEQGPFPFQLIVVRGSQGSSEEETENRGFQEHEETLLAFFIDRLKVYLRQRKNLRPDIIDAVLFHSDDLLEIYCRAEALAAYFPDTQEGKAVLKGYKRAANILRAEGIAPDVPDPNETLLDEQGEKNLHRDIIDASQDITAAMNIDDYKRAVEVCARLCGPIDDFFDNVRVNVENTRLRDNRLLLLRQTCRTLERVADFSKISEK